MNDSKFTVPRDAYTKMLNIDTRQTNIMVRFEPKDVKKMKNPRSALLRQTALVDSTEGESPYFRFEIREKNRNSKPAAILLDIDSIRLLTQILDSEETGEWIKSAAEVRYIEETHLLRKKYCDTDCIEISPGVFCYTDPQYHVDFFEVASRRDNCEGIADSVIPLKLMYYTNEDWTNNDPSKVTVGSTMTIFYQPKVKGGKEANKPWVVEIVQYQLKVDGNGVSTRQGENTKSIKLSSRQMNHILNKLLADFGLWCGNEELVNDYWCNPDKFNNFLLVCQ